ncbi:hypothetical protein [Marinobacter phage PS6]|nr:hypothetical protein [Marinobacter phage PS6]
MKTLIALVTAALVSGCGNQPVRVETVEVSVPVPVPCVDRETVPDIIPGAEDEVVKGSLPGEKIKAVLIERERLRKADTKFRALVQGCLL